ncbi:hypothetical protein DN540_32270, partial [Burkholderia multivorans]
MAYVKMGQIKSTLGKALAYIARDDATQGGVFVSTNAAVIDPSDHNAVAAMMTDTSEQMGPASRRGSVLAHHVIQSFDPSETVDAETAHRVGVEFAESITGGEYEYMIATHVDKDHVHNHIIFNAVNMKTGRKFRCQRDTISRFRSVSDTLCMRAGLSVMPEPPKRTTGKSLADIYLVVKGESHKRFLQTEIDKAAQFSRSFDELEGQLRLAGIEVSRRQGSLSFRAEDQKRAVRDYRLGEAFTESAIMARLARQEVNRIDVDQSMIVHDDAHAVRVRVPGSRGQLTLTLARNQIVEHGRTMRAYIPAHGDHALADRRGRFVRHVSTTDLYQWFSQPKPDRTRVSSIGGIDLAQLNSWHKQLGQLHALEDRVNARLRWAPAGNIHDGLSAARERAAAVKVHYQAQLVAVTEALDDASVKPETLEGLAAGLRNTERELSMLQRDVTALEALDEQRIDNHVHAEDRSAPTEGREMTMRERVEHRAQQILQEQAAANDAEALALAEEEDRSHDEDLQPDAPAPVGDSRDVDPHAEVRERVRAQAAEILARANRANAASGVEQAQDDFATDRAEAEEDLHRDLVQGDGDGDVLNVSTNRIETRNEQRRPREDKPEREMT